ncbi:VOC family protein [Ideonella sp. A 288]|uniref:VOC family protein n=1 Tax=Ideonella sp. A 288 TaxID=1962181 RepID=UPI0018FEB575|nr:VOC family protein [Ideonella sp. A 288]
MSLAPIGIHPATHITQDPSTMDTEALEHLNLTVADLDATLAFLQAALPTWQVRGEGRLDWHGKAIRWLHVGTPSCYIALQGGGEGEAPDWTGHAIGARHAGLRVPSLDAVVQRLALAGHAVDHPGGTHPHRRSVYYTLPGALQFEFVEYLSDDPAQRNDYAR